MIGHLELRPRHLPITRARFTTCLPNLFRTFPQRHVPVAMISSSSRLWSQAVSQEKTVPIRTFQELPLDKNLYNAFQNLKHNSSIAKDLPILNQLVVENVVENVGQNLHKFVIDDQVMVTNDGLHFKHQNDHLSSLEQELRDTKKELIARVDGINATLGDTTMRLDDTTMRLDDKTMRLDSTTMRLDDTMMRLDDTTMRLDDTMMRLDDTTMRLDSTTMRLDDTMMRLDDTTMRLDNTTMKLGDLTMKVSNMHSLSCQSEFLNVLRDMSHVTFDKGMKDGQFSAVTRRVREARNLEVHHITLQGCMDACQSFMAEKDSPSEWETLFEVFFEVSLGEAEMKLIPLVQSSPDFQIEAIMAAQANLLLSCQMDQFPNVFQKWLKAVLEYFDLEQVGRPSLSSPHSETKLELEDNYAPLFKARKHIQELAVECLKSEKEDRAGAASKGMVTGLPLSKESLNKRFDKWKEGGQWENLVKLTEMYKTGTKGKTGGNKRF